MWKYGILRPEMIGGFDYVSVIKPGTVVIFTFDGKRLLGVVTHSAGCSRGWRAIYVKGGTPIRPEDVPSHYTITSDNSIVDRMRKEFHRIIQRAL